MYIYVTDDLICPRFLFTFSLMDFVTDDKGPIDCTGIHKSHPGVVSGLYTVELPVMGHVTVFCDMETDGGGWTVTFILICSSELKNLFEMLVVRQEIRHNVKEKLE